MRWRRRRAKIQEIAPEEIFLDSANAPSFDRARFEGRLERPLSSATFYILAGVLALIFAILGSQAWNLEVLQGTAYAAESAKNSLDEAVLFAHRGVVTDASGTPLITNTEDEDGQVKRVYATPGFGSVLGYVSYPKKDSSGLYYDTTINGLAGIEASFDQLLGGANGTLLVEKDALGQVESQGTVVPAQNGENLTLTIDTRAQKAFYDAISSLADQIPFLGGAGVLMDVNTGAVRALVSYPEYDPNVLSGGGPASTIAGYNRDPRKPYLDRAVTGLYTPGSIVKPIEAAGALTDGVITPDVTINDTGSISIPNPYDAAHPNIFKDWKAIGVEDLRKAIAFSSDVYFYMVGGGYGNQKGLGIDRLAYWYKAFGLTEPTGIELPNESAGFVPTPAWKQATYDEGWTIGDTYHTAIGQYAMQVTPLEMARAIGAVANGGKLVKPTLLADAPVEGESIDVSPDALEVVREGMRQGVIGDGTSSGLSPLDSFVHLAGKTGTAQTGLHNEYYNSWAVGFWPYEHPKYVYVVVMEKGPAGNSTGAVYAMSQILETLHRTAPEYFP